MIVATLFIPLWQPCSLFVPRMGWRERENTPVAAHVIDFPFSLSLSLPTTKEEEAEVRRRKKLSRSTKKERKKRDEIDPRWCREKEEKHYHKGTFFCYSFSSFFAPGQILLLFISPSFLTPLMHTQQCFLLPAGQWSRKRRGDTFLCSCATDSHKKMRDQKAGEASFFVSLG